VRSVASSLATVTTSYASENTFVQKTTQTSTQVIWNKDDSMPLVKSAVAVAEHSRR